MFYQRDGTDSHGGTIISHTESTESTEIHWFIRDLGIGYLYNKTNGLAFLQIEPIKDIVLVQST